MHDARGTLGEAVETPPFAPRSRVPIGAEGGVHDSRPQAGNLLERKTMRGEGARAVAVHEHVGLRYQFPQRFPTLFAAQINMG